VKFAITTQPQWLVQMRNKYSLECDLQSWPTKKVELWRRTQMESLPVDEFQTHFEHLEISDYEKDSSYSAVVLIEDSRKVKIWSGSEKITIRNLEDQDEENFKNHLFQNPDRFLSDHLARMDFTLIIEIDENAVLDKPILVHWNASSNPMEKTMYRPRILFKARRLSEVHAVVRWDSSDTVFINGGTSAFIGESANFTLTEIQALSQTSYQVDHSLSVQERNSVFNYNLVSIGTATAKTQWDASLIGEGAEIKAQGIFVCKGKQHKDLRLVLNHKAPRGKSNSLFKGAVRDRGRTIFQGLIEVTPEGKGTDAYLSIKNLILNDGARADSLPQLKIDHNDLKCTHGSTTGKVDEEQLHYLQSRGFSPSESKVLITMGLFQGIIDSLPTQFRIPVESTLEQLLREG